MLISTWFIDAAENQPFKAELKDFLPTSPDHAMICVFRQVGSMLKLPSPVTHSTEGEAKK